MRRSLAMLAALAVLGAPAAARAFCGFYVSGAGADLFNNATQVVLMREGTRTVLSMQNNYQGPPTDFAMVVPVPVVLEKENVKTLPHEIFARVDKLSAPRLVEYWEQDPCQVRRFEQEDRMAMVAESGAAPADAPAADLGVKIEAKFKVGEYDIVILSARDSTGLDTWLRQEKYKIPPGAEPFLKPYVQGGSKFFVARVDIEKVVKRGGRVTLSPLRFHYDTDEFNLPIRLGMMNSSGKQDLIVNILAPGQRYEVANYGNVTIPTNLDVAEEARGRFGEFYAALFDRTLERNKGAVVTEYSWDATSCDPCPEPPLEPGELMVLGADVLRGGQAQPGDTPPPGMFNFVLTRLHARYAKGAISEDLVFKAAPPISGGREVYVSSLLGKLLGKPSLEKGAQPASMNNFQGRYAVRHEWTGPIACASPVRGVWGGPPGNQQIAAPVPATDLAFVPRGKVQLARMVRRDVPEIGVVALPKGARVDPVEPAKPGKEKPEDKGCAASGGAGAGASLLLGIALMFVRRRRR
jgi:hypothetical protein